MADSAVPDSALVHRANLNIAAAVVAKYGSGASDSLIRSSWYLSGLEELKRAGLRLQNLWSARIKNGVFLAIRILIAILLALLNGVFTGTLIFRKDIDGEIARAHLARLAPLMETARQHVDGELQRNAEARDQGWAWIAKAEEEVARLRRSPADDDAGRSHAGHAARRRRDCRVPLR